MSWRAHWPELGILVLGMLASAGLAWLDWQWERREWDAGIGERVEVCAHALSETLQRFVDDVRALAQFYAASESIQPEEFARFTRPFVQRQAVLRALEWAPRVEDGERMAFEAAARAQGLADFVIRDRVDGRMQPAGARPVYFPVLRVEPLAGNEGALGFDLASETRRRAALERACESGRPVASASVTLAQEPAAQRGMLLFAPQYRDDAMDHPMSARCAGTRGFAVGVLRMGDLVEGVLGRLPYQDLDLLLSDADDDGGVLYLRPAPVRGDGDPVDVARLADVPHAQEAALSFAGRRLVLRGATMGRAPRGVATPFVVLVLGLSITAASGALVWNRRNGARRLLASEERLRFATDAAKLGLWDWDLATGRIVWSWHHERLWGFAPGEFDGTFAAFASRLHPDDVPRVEQELARCEAERVQYVQEFRVVWPDGSLHWILSQGEYVLDSAGRAIRMSGSAMEITARKQAELHLRRYRQIVETSNEMLVLVDGTLRYQVVNPAYTALYGTTPETLRGRRVEDVVRPEIQGRLLPALRAALNGESRRLMVEGRDAAGERRWIETTLTPFVENGEVQGVVASLHDLTEVRVAQAALEAEQAHLEERVAARTADLQRSEAKLRTIYDLLPMGISITDPDGRVVDCNSASLSLLGLTRDEHLRRNYDGPEWRLVRPDGTPMPPEEYASVRALQEARTLRDVEMGVVRPEGITWLSVSAMPTPHPDYGVVIAFVDITALKQAEMQARQLAERLSLAAEVGDIGVWEWDLVHDRHIWDGRLYALYGLREDDAAPGQATWLERVHPEDRELAVARTEQAIRNGETLRQTFRAIWPDGTVHHLQTVAKVTHNARDGTPERILGVIWDVTEQTLAQEALKASEARARAIIDASPVPKAIADQAGRITYINRAFVRTFGYGIEEIPTLDDWHLRAFPDPDYRRDVERRWRDYKADLRESPDGGEPQEAVVQCRDGTRRRILAKVVALGGLSETDTGMVLATLHDITELKQAQAEAEEALRAKSQFLAHMSHEIRTPMNGIIGLAEVALHKAVEPEVRADLVQIRRSAASLLGILNDILDHSRIEAGRLSLEAAPFDLDDLLATLRALFDQGSASKGLDLILEVGAGVPRQLLGDVLRLQQVLSNLLGNAIKFTDSGAVRLQVTELASDAARAHLRWSVTDTGIGMDAGALSRLFEPFVQGDDSIARRFGGTGLGLSISRDLLHLMGSELCVESRAGAGTTFSFELVLEHAEASPRAPPVAAAHSADLGQLRLLVAEDNLVNQRIIGDMLRLLGISFTLARDGRAALECLAESRYDAVLMDVQMPRMDGLSAAREIRANPAWADLPVIALTAGVTSAERERVVQVGMSDLLSKPVTLDALRSTLERWLGRILEAPPDLGGAGPAETLSLPGFDLGSLLQVDTEVGVGRLLHQFAQVVRDEVDSIAATLSAEGGLAAAAQVHRLKGSAGMVGATALQAAAAELERLLQSGGDPETRLDRLRAAHAEALAAIAGLPPPAPDVLASHPDQALAQRLAAELHTQATAGMVVAQDDLEALAAALPEGRRELYVSLRDAFDRFDYRTARDLLKRLLAGDPDSEEGDHAG